MLKRIGHWFAIMAFLTLFTTNGFADGIDGIRWRLTYQTIAGYAQSDIYTFNLNQMYFYPVNGANAIGTLGLSNYAYGANGQVSTFEGPWQQSGVSGKYKFNVSYDANNRPVQMSGFYSQPSPKDPKGDIRYIWSAVPIF